MEAETNVNDSPHLKIKDYFLVLAPLVLYYYDLVSDILVIIQLGNKQEWIYFTISMIILVASCFYSAITSNQQAHARSDPTFKGKCENTRTVLALLHLDYLYMVIQMLFFKNNAIRYPFKSLKFAETTSESIPQILLQSFILLNDGYTILLIISITASFLSILVATVWKDIDGMNMFYHLNVSKISCYAFMLLLYRFFEFTARIINICFIIFMLKWYCLIVFGFDVVMLVLLSCVYTSLYVRGQKQIYGYQIEYMLNIPIWMFGYYDDPTSIHVRQRSKQYFMSHVHDDEGTHIMDDKIFWIYRMFMVVMTNVIFIIFRENGKILYETNIVFWTLTGYQLIGIVVSSLLYYIATWLIKFNSISNTNQTDIE